MPGMQSLKSYPPPTPPPWWGWLANIFVNLSKQFFFVCSFLEFHFHMWDWIVCVESKAHLWLPNLYQQLAVNETGAPDPPSSSSLPSAPTLFSSHHFSLTISFFTLMPLSIWSGLCFSKSSCASHRCIFLFFLLTLEVIEQCVFLFSVLSAPDSAWWESVLV